ncbi:hypothetical protein [Nocardia brasiliensis]|uniref:hypothetical protein n=1 Tax=Nocardia brasiliensis TaxID=37326 RepID=UPI0024545A75|nr:hypothetical protein [Nocardia brasiliensis]
MAAPATKLLKDLEPLAAPQRRRAIAGTALRLRGTPEFDALLSDLGARGHYERVLAGQLATIAADRAHLLAQLDSAEAEFGCRALAGLVRVGVAPAELVTGCRDFRTVSGARCIERSGVVRRARIWPMRYCPR